MSHSSLPACHTLHSRINVYGTHTIIHWLHVLHRPHIQTNVYVALASLAFTPAQTHDTCNCMCCSGLKSFKRPEPEWLNMLQEAARHAEDELVAAAGTQPVSRSQLQQGQQQQQRSLSQRRAQGAVSYLVGAQALGVQVDPAWALQLLGRHTGANTLQGCSSVSLASLAAALQAMGSAPSGDLLEAYVQVGCVMCILISSVF
jgi:hypothetical protein